MDRIWQWAWTRYAPRYSWAMCAISVPLALQNYLLFAVVVVAFEESDRYVEAAVVAVAAVLAQQFVAILPGRGPIHVVERWAAGHEIDRASALEATYSWARGAV